MIKKLSNISMRQVFIIFIVMLGTPTLRVLPAHTVEKAGHAAWLCPISSILIMLIYLPMVRKIFDKYENMSFVNIMEEVFGIILGKTLAIIYFFYTTIVSAYYIRAYAERLTGSLSTSTSYLVYIGVMLVFLSYVLKFGLPIIARANEILFWFTIIPFICVSIFMLPKVSISNFYPITYKDIIPSIQGGAVILGVWSQITFLFIFSDKISNKKNVFKIGIKAVVVLTLFTLSAILTNLGIFGTSVANLSYPYVSAVQTISLFGTIERVEAVIVVVWIMIDFSLISILIFSGLHILESTFRLSDSKPLINIYIVLLFFLSIYITDNVYDLQSFSGKVLIYVHTVFGFFIPFIMFFIGRLRRKF